MDRDGTCQQGYHRFPRLSNGCRAVPQFSAVCRRMPQPLKTIKWQQMAKVDPYVHVNPSGIIRRTSLVIPINLVLWSILLIKAELPPPP
jgi:hypothetical protein